MEEQKSDVLCGTENDDNLYNMDEIWSKMCSLKLKTREGCKHFICGDCFLAKKLCMSVPDVYCKYSK